MVIKSDSSGKGYTYDGNGNLEMVTASACPVADYSWNAENRLSSASWLDEAWRSAQP